VRHRKLLGVRVVVCHSEWGFYVLGRRRAELPRVFWQTGRLKPVRSEGTGLGGPASSDKPEKKLRFNSA
jgi:hypothetical protein